MVHMEDPDRMMMEKASRVPVHLRLYLQGKEMMNYRDSTFQRLGIHGSGKPAASAKDCTGYRSNGGRVGNKSPQRRSKIVCSKKKPSGTIIQRGTARQRPPSSPKGRKLKVPFMHKVPNGFSRLPRVFKHVQDEADMNLEIPPINSPGMAASPTKAQCEPVHENQILKGKDGATRETKKLPINGAKPQIDRIEDASSNNAPETIEHENNPEEEPQANDIVVATSPKKSGEMHKMMEQLQVLKETLGLSEEELEWKVASSKGNAFKLASEKLFQAEENYERDMYAEMTLQQNVGGAQIKTILNYLKTIATSSKNRLRLKSLIARGTHEVAKLKKVYLDASVEAEIMAVNTRGEAPVSTEVPRRLKLYEAAQHELKSNIQQLEDIVKKMRMSYTGFTKTAGKLESIVEKTSTPDHIIFTTLATLCPLLRKIVDQTATDVMQSEAVDICTKLNTLVNKEITKTKYTAQVSLSSVETWTKRKLESKEYNAEISKLEIEWRDKNAKKNEACLRRLRSLIPPNIKALTAPDIVKLAKSHGVLCTHDLAAYLKQNKFLHWCVLHPKDIVRSNFLAGDSQQYFQNLEQYDITELRAIYHCLPVTFDFDNDGRKANWRASLVNYLKSLVRQEDGECVLAGWDPEKQCRRSIQLKPVSDKQRLNKLYTYPSASEIEARIRKFDAAVVRLKDKREQLKALEDTELPASKEEYDAILTDARCNRLQKEIGKEQLSVLRNEAKTVYQTLTKKFNTLRSDIANMEKVSQSAYPTYEQYILESAEVKNIVKSHPSMLIPGYLNDAPEILEIRRATICKKLSVADEARQRKEELRTAIGARVKAIPNALPKTLDEKPLQVSGSRRPSVAISPQVQKFLEKSFGSPTAKSSSVVLSPKVKIQVKNTLDSAEKEVPALNPRSKTLKRFLSGVFDPETGEDTMQRRSSITNLPTQVKRPSFLQELQSKKPSFLSELSAKATPKPSFVSELKTKASSKQNTNFLAELKSRVNKP